MGSWNLAIAYATMFFVALTISGALTQRRTRLCWSFLGYLATVFVCHSLFNFWPARFFNYSSWLVCQSVTDVARLAVALELGFRVFRAFPGARATARFVTLVVLVATTLALISMRAPSATDSPASLLASLSQWHARLLSGSIWLMTSTALLVLWYHLPIQGFLRDILVGFTPYLLVFTTLLNLLHEYGWKMRERFNVLEPIAYLVLTAWWAYAAWRREDDIAISPDVARKLRLA